MNLRAVLTVLAHDPALIDDGTQEWLPSYLLERLEQGEADLHEGERRLLDEEVYFGGKSIALLDEQGYQISPALYTITYLSKAPYQVRPEKDGYRVIFLRDKESDSYRFIDGQSFYVHKQAAHRRKKHLNETWQKDRSLDA